MDKVQKIREKVERLKSQLLRGACSSQIAMETMCKEEAYNEVLAILDTMQEEPVNEDLISVAKQYIDSHVFGNEEDKFTRSVLVDMFCSGAKWQKEKEYTCYEEAFEDGAKWMVENLWKPADGDDLPEYEREVIVMIKYDAQLNIHDEEYPTYRVGFGHRPNPNGWNGTNIDTGEKEHFEPVIYDKGGWNIPDVKFWLDIELPKEIEL